MDKRLAKGMSWARGAPREAFAWAGEWLDLLLAAGRGWVADRAPSMGAAIAYYTVFSLAPVLILVIAVAGLVFGKQAAEGALFDEIAALVGRESAGAVQALLRSASGTASGIVATLIGIGALLLAATGVFGEVQAALNVIWRARAAESAGALDLVKKRLRSLALIIGIGILLVVSVALSAALEAFSAYFDRLLPGLPFVLDGLDFLLSFAMTTLLFAMIFKVLPDADVEWRDVWIGAAATALLFAIGRYFIGLYIGTSGVNSVYHAAGALVLLLVWIYYSAQILLFGAEFAKATGDRRRARRAAMASATKSHDPERP